MNTKQKRISFAIKSKKGKRPVNQDALVCCFNQNDDFCAVVCDGVGSVRGSEYASNTVANTFADKFEETKDIENPVEWFKQTLKIALERVYRCSVARNLPGISTTLAILIISGNKFYSFNIGDTRIYRINENEVKQISYDHIYKNYLISKGTSKSNLEAMQNKWFALTGFIDPANPKSATFDTNSGEINQQSLFLLCTDGLYKVLNKQDIYQNTWKKKGLPLVFRASLLNHKALKKNSNDNVSNIVINVK